eukprot:COSAG06_NODE_56830_length_283_cov_0.538043_2_plen_34_part_01
MQDRVWISAVAASAKTQCNYRAHQGALRRGDGGR